MGKEIILISPGMTAGGAERVMSIIANCAVRKGYRVDLILLYRGEKFFDIDSTIRVHEPDFEISTMSRVMFQLRCFFWLRRTLQSISTRKALSFSGKYNAFALLASIGLNKEVFVSDRSRPGISYGRFLDFLNPRVYPVAKGLIAQTSQAKTYGAENYRIQNIEIIPNPVRQVPEFPYRGRKDIVLNVGRFISSKHQDHLIDLFDSIDTQNWKLVFLGDGPLFNAVKEKAILLSGKTQIEFPGSVSDVSSRLAESAVFAFTSSSEGFPNALAEAMAHGCACIAYDCLAGPRDIIDDGVNGFLVPEGDHEMYREKLSQLLGSEELRVRFSKAAKKKMEMFEESSITRKYLTFIEKS